MGFGKGYKHCDQGYDRPNMSREGRRGREDEFKETRHCEVKSNPQKRLKLSQQSISNGNRVQWEGYGSFCPNNC
jgi:hypothetical protein